MRAITAAILLALSVVTAAQAQTYDPRYPVCLQVWGTDGSSISCRFGSMAQCRAVASGRAAQCVSNPYFAKRRR
jgi:hypothetical protein